MDQNFDLGPRFGQVYVPKQPKIGPKLENWTSYVFKLGPSNFHGLLTYLILYHLKIFSFEASVWALTPLSFKISTFILPIIADIAVALIRSQIDSNFIVFLMIFLLEHSFVFMQHCFSAMHITYYEWSIVWVDVPNELLGV